MTSAVRGSLRAALIIAAFYPSGPLQPTQFTLFLTAALLASFGLKGDALPLEARLRPDNEGSLLARLFTVEYAANFEVLLPALGFLRLGQDVDLEPGELGCEPHVLPAAADHQG